MALHAAARKLVLISLLLIASGDVTAAPSEGFYLQGADTDCGDWVKARKADRSSILEAFVVGTLNGMALGGKRELWRAAGDKVSDESVFLWMDNYCNANPLSKVVTGIVALFRERTGPAVRRK